MPDLPCKDCGLPVPLGRSDCPHCGRPSLFPNVQAAELDGEQSALAARYRAAIEDAESRGCGEVLRAFESAAGAAQAVLTRPFADVERLASSDRQLQPTYYQLLEAEARLPYGDRWDKLRRLADAALFPGYEKDIRFAALSLDGTGLPSYGECSLVLREDMIAHRASVFDENSALLMERWAYNPPMGLRAVWQARALLCVAKLAGELRPDTQEEEFAKLLLSPGTDPENDCFVEVHIWGSMSGWTLERVVFTPAAGNRPPPKYVVKGLRAELAKFDIELEER